MYSISFPEMITGNVTRLSKDKEAVKTNLWLTLSSERRSLFGDPRFGSLLKRLIFEQGNSIIYDLVVDELYTTILTFVPQIRVSRKDITLFTQNNNLYVTIQCVYAMDNTSDLYTIQLTDSVES